MGFNICGVRVVSCSKERSFKKASPAEKTAIETVLSALNIDGARTMDSQQSALTIDGAGTIDSQQSALTIDGAGTIVPAASSAGSAPWREPDAADRASCIFRRVLSNKISDASSCTSPHRSNPATTTSVAASLLGSGLLESLGIPDSNYDLNERRMLLESRRVPPISKDGKSQVQRVRAVIGKDWRKGSGKGKGKATKDNGGKGSGKGKGKANKAKPASATEAKATDEKPPEARKAKAIKAKPASATEAKATDEKPPEARKASAIKAKPASATEAKATDEKAPEASKGPPRPSVRRPWSLKASETDPDIV
jgi:hypothetical protein